MKRLLVMFVLLSPLCAAQVTPDGFMESHPCCSTQVFLLPVGSDTGWQEFAFLSAIPASHKASRIAPSVIALDDFGMITDEVRDYLARLGPYRIYLVGSEAEFSMGHWYLDEGSGITAVDSSGNEYDGIIHGASWSGGSLEFDGFDDYVDITGYQGIAGAGARSVAAWIKTTDTGCEILSWGQFGIPGGCWIMGIDDRGILKLCVGDAYVAGETKVNDGAWHHVAVCLDDDVPPHIGNVKLFVDGLPEKAGEIWDAASGALKNNLLGYWQMNEGSGTVIYDGSSGGSQGTFHTDFSAGGDYPDWGPGLLGTGLYFDNLDYIEIDNEPHFGGTASAFTVSCWIKHNWDWGVGGNDKFVTKGNMYKGGWQTGRPDDSTYISVDAAGQKVETQAANQKDVWHHVVGAYDGNELYIYVNGDEQDKKLIGPIGSNNVPLYIGCGADPDGNPSSSGPTNGRYKGWIDEVAIWDRDLADDEIDMLYNNGAGMVIDTTSTPIDTKAADTVKIGVFNATQDFFQGSLEDVRIYDRALTAAQVLSLKERRDQDYTGFTKLPGTSLDETACSMADTFWHQTRYVVLCEESDYPRALSASVLASRLKVPLLYFDEAAGLSTGALATVGGLNPSQALLVGQNSFVEGQLIGIGIPTTTLLDAQEVLAWMINNYMMEVEYLALVNPNDRELGRVTKSSLAGALLAAGRKGALVPLAYESMWKHPFWYDGVVGRRPDGAPDSITGLWYTGTLCLETKTYDFVISTDHPIHYNMLNIDFNGNGNYGDPGDGPYESADVVEIEGTRYALSVGEDESITPGNIKFTYPCADEVKEDLAPFYTTMGHFPEYLCIVGLPEAVPFGLANGCYAYADSEDLPTDSLFGNVDDDLFIEIAVGRVFGENLCCITLLASRSLTYNALVNNPDTWAKRCMWTGEFWNQMHVMPRLLENTGFYPAVINSFMPGYDKSLLNVVIQDDHGGPGGIGGGWNTDLETLLAPCIVEAGGCDSAGIDETTLDQTLSGQLLKKGSIAYIGTQRGTPGDKRIYRLVMWNAVLEGATLGQAHRRGLNAMWMAYLDEFQPPVYMHYCLHSEALYGDPALKIYVPSEPILAPAHTEAAGTTFSAVAPEIFWIDQITGHGAYDGYYHNGPGMHPDYDQSIQFFFAEWKTDQPVTAMIQDPSIPSPLGGTGIWAIDEHPDGTYSVYTRVRFTQFNNNTGQITKEVDRVDFEVRF